MPTPERVEALISKVERGQYLEAIRDFYTENASMQENLQPPRQGLAKLLEQEQKTLASVKEIRGKAVTFFLDGDRVAINWTFEFIGFDGRTRRMDEIAWQLWQGDKIAQEKFYYDPAQFRGEGS